MDEERQVETGLPSEAHGVVARSPKGDVAIQGTRGALRSPGSPRRFAARDDGQRRSPREVPFSPFIRL